MKRFFADSIHKAIRMVREELGPDALILTSQEVPGGVEVIAGIDTIEAGAVNRDCATDVLPTNNLNETQIESSSLYAEIQSLRDMLEGQLSKLAWNSVEQKSPTLTHVADRLTRHGISLGLSKRIAHSISTLQGTSLEATWKAALKQLADLIPIYQGDLTDYQGLMCLLGPSGVGKTATMAKIVGRRVLRHGAADVAIVSFNPRGLGGHEVNKSLGRVLNVTVNMVDSLESLPDTIESLKEHKCVILDTFGFSKNDTQANEIISTIKHLSAKQLNVLVLSATMQHRAMLEYIKLYQDMVFSAAVVTKVDECTSFGEVLSVLVENNLPLAYISDGQSIPEDLRPARPNNIVHMMMEITKHHDQLKHQIDDILDKQRMVNAND